MANVRYSDHDNLSNAISALDVFPMDEHVSGAVYRTRKASATQIQEWAQAGLSAVAVSGSYNDLEDAPSLFDGAFASLSGKPTTLAGYGITDAVPQSRTITANNGISGGGDLSANRVFGLDLSGLTAETSIDGADLVVIYDASASAHRKMTRANFVAGISPSVTWGVITGTLSSQTDLQSALDLKANLSALGAAALSNSYNDLDDLPSLFDGAYASLSGKPTLGTAAALNVAASGDAASGEVVKGNDTRLSDARTPTAHNQAWSTITSTPTTLAGYGITDAYPLTGNPSNFLTANQTITFSGDASGSGSTSISLAIGATKVTSAMLNADVYSTAHSWVGQQTFTAPILGTPASGTLTNATGLPPTTGIVGWPANSAGVLTNNGAGVLTWGAGGGGLTVGTTTVASGTAGRVFYETAGNVLGEISGVTSDGASITALPVAGVITQTSASATAFESGPNGGTNPVFRLINNTASQANGIAITGRASGANALLSVISSAASESLDIEPKGTAGVVRLRINSNNTFQVRLNDTLSSVPMLGSANNTVDLGSASVTWRSLYLGTSLLLGTSQDVILRRNAAANLALGAADAASPVAQTLSVQNVVAGTSNTAGAAWTLRGSLGTSQGAPGRIHMTTGAMIAASGTTQQTAIDRLVIGASKVLTNNSAVAITNLTAAASLAAGGILDYMVEVFDGTDLQVEVGTLSYMVNNKGGVFSGNGTPTKYGNQQDMTSGTLTVTFALSGANPAVLTVNANSSLTPSTGYPRITYLPRNLSQQAISIQ